MSDTEGPDEDPDLPSAQECDRRCTEFVSITQTDSALAMFFLQDRKWDVEKSVSDYFQSVENEEMPSFKRSQKESSSETSTPANAAVSSEEIFVDPEPHRIRLMSWNIDGLDQNNVQTRAKAVCQTILKQNPDIVFLQEVTAKNLAILNDQCHCYHVILGNTGGKPKNNGEYFTAVLLRRATSIYSSHKVTPFYSSQMARTLLQVEATVKGIEFNLMTSHLESTKDYAAERVRQLKTAFVEMSMIPKNKVAIFGGDLNLRDKEVDKAEILKNGIVDVWEATGARVEAKFTWDMTRNDNLEMPFPAKCRFDRLYYRTGNQLKAVYFELVGFERIDSCRRFPSDHWGILAHFDKV